MNQEKLRTDMIALFEETFQARIHRKTYESEIDKLKNSYKMVLEDIKQVIEASDADLEVVALHIPEYASEKLKNITSKRKRELTALDYNMNMVSFFVPLMGEVPSLQAKILAEKTVEKWNELMPDTKIGVSTVAGIEGGFKKGLCYITTAVCESLGKPDDCYELSLLRGYRDEYLLSTREGSVIVTEYYDIAPTIVKRISKEADAADIYSSIWNEYLSPCVRLIETDHKEECKELYSEMVHKLEKKYLYS